MFSSCPYVRDVCYSTTKNLNNDRISIRSALTLEQLTQIWRHDAGVRCYCTFLALFVFNIWEARNKANFQNKWVPPNITTLLLQKVQEHKTVPKPSKHRVIIILEIDKRFTQAYFDEASQGDPPLGGVGGILHLSETIKLCIKYAPGQASNSRVELEALWAVLKVTQSKLILRIQMYGDSKMVIDWAKEKRHIIETHLQYFLIEIRSLVSSFEFVSYTHIYRELNSKVDLLSKMELVLQLEVIEVEEYRNGQSIEHLIMIQEVLDLQQSKKKNIFVFSSPVNGTQSAKINDAYFCI